MSGRAIIALAVLFAHCASLFAANPAPPQIILEQGVDHWSFQPIRKPPVKDSRAGENAIDFLVGKRLRKEGLSLSREASRATLIRRLYLDVVGYPPDPEEVRAFVEDRNPRAVEELVDRLLASPHYGERWARHWLDVVRFAESNGFETNTPRRNAWRFRDYIIRALNEDLPYDQFVIQQLAGDAVDAPVATGFLVGGPWDEVKSPDPGLTAQQRMDELHDMVATTASTFLGLTIGCARCHNHKFDPISQVDYYALQAVFAGVQHGERTLPTPNDPERIAEVERLRTEILKLDKQIDASEPLAAPGQTAKRAPVHARMNVERFAPATTTRVRFTVEKTNGGEPCIDELEIFDVGGTNVALAARGVKATASGTYPNSDIHRLEHINDGKHGNGRSWISNESGKGWVELEFPNAETIEKIRWGRDREEKFADRLATSYRVEILMTNGSWKIVADSSDRMAVGEKAPDGPVGELVARRKKADDRGRELTLGPVAYAGRFDQPGPTYRLHRGEALQKKEQVVAAMPVRFAKIEYPADAPEQERRLALAKWIVDPANPLTARVMANRVWQFHFGAGIVDTPSDFGLNGAMPTDPELLDYLASYLVENKWSLKRLHRAILLSAVYRQSSDRRADGMEKDAGSRLLWRFPPRRLEAEALRDSILRVCGNLDLAMGGRGFDLFEPNENYVRVFSPRKTFGATEWRRMIYATKHRMQIDDTFGSFDCPDAGQIQPKRTTSTTPLQALNLLNSPFMMQQADILAKRLEREAGAKAEAQARRAFWLAFDREAAPEEVEGSAKLIAEEGLPSFCRALLNANEFVYVF
jgi:hypothetical protein